jgi:phage gpG-like protein
VNYYIEVLGDKLVSTKFERMGYAALDARPAMEEVAVVMFGIFKKIFDSGGRRGGGSWRQDSPEWLERKIKNGLDPRVLHATLALRNAFTEPDADHQILAITKRSVSLGTDLPYAAKQNRERPFSDKFTTGDKLMIRMVIRNHLIRAWRTARV